MSDLIKCIVCKKVIKGNYMQVKYQPAHYDCAKKPSKTVRK